MNKTISPKITALTFGILATVFLAAFYVVAWQEPTSAPPGGNVATPLNVGITGQSKEGGLILNTGGAVTGLIIDKGEVCIGTDCRTSWPETGIGIPSGMIAMFDTACPAGWTRFAALDNRFPQGSSIYGGTGGSVSKTTSGHQHDQTYGEALPNSPSYPTNVYVPVHTGAPWGLGQGWNGFDQRKYVELKSAALGLGNWSSALTSPKTDTISDIRPPYLSVIWCKKD